MAEYRLEMRGVSKSFPGVKALDKVNLKVRPGTVHALMGENGAGKSTLMKCLFGIYHMDEGEIYVDGEKDFPPFEEGQQVRIVSQGNLLIEYEILSQDKEKQLCVQS